MKYISHYRLGLDIGTNSIGFALVPLDSKKHPQDVLHMGVRIFSDGRDPQKGASLAVDRRIARGMRRRRDRFVRRQERVMEHLIEAGLMPQDAGERKKLEGLDPYALRVRGLDEKLTPYELGRALFHLNQRRGFKSNRKMTSEDKQEDGKISEGIRKLLEEMAKGGYRSIGEYLFHNDQKRVRSRMEKVFDEKRQKEKEETIYDFYPQRQLMEEEFDRLLEKQAAFHPQLLSADGVKRLRENIFHQRELCPVERGTCTVMGKPYQRAYAALPSSQYFRLLKEVNNLKIKDTTIRRNWPYLSDDQRKTILDHLSKHKKAEFSVLARKISLQATESFNLESDVRDTVYGLDTAVTLANKKCFGALWPESLPAQDDIVLQLLEQSAEANDTWLRENYPALSEEQRGNIISATPGLEDGTLRYSKEAIEQLIEELQKPSEKEPERYKDEHEAVTACGWQYACHYTGEIVYHVEEKDIGWQTPLPYYGVLLEHKTQPVKYGSPLEKEHGRIANPTVHVALNQLRKLVNDVIAQYGHPKEIAVEFSRELKQTKKEKENRSRENKKNQEANKRYDDAAKEAKHAVTANTRLKQKLWEQQDRCCIYSGKSLELSEVLSEATEIDHILPRETLDDSNANKVLVLQRLNQHKRKRTPYEAFCIDTHPQVNWEELLLRVEKHIPNKKWRFTENAMDQFKELQEREGGWLPRQLTDTSYMARVAREYLRYVVGDRVKGFPAVDTYSGGITYALRKEWGLNKLLNEDNEKLREDHRHHAVDALVIACANRSLMQKISTANAAGKKLDDNWTTDANGNKIAPYAHFDWVTLQQKVDAIVISHKPDHGTPGNGGSGSTSGRLHEDTFYGLAKEQPDPKEEKIRLVVRKPLIGFPDKDIADICDADIRRRLVQAIEQRQSDQTPEQAMARFAQESGIRRVKVYVEKSRKAMKAIHDKRGKPYRYVATGGNHHVDIYCPIKDNKILKAKAGKWCAEAISTFDANQKGFEPQWRKDHPAAKLVMRLHINDMVAYEENGRTVCCRVQKISNKASGIVIFVKQHNDASTKDGWGASAKQLQEKNARKIAVTPAGKVLDPGRAPMPKPFREPLL